MALRDQPYLPLYVQDYLTDEKLNECCASTQGIYIKIMCIMHKSDEYGCILLEQKYKQTDNQIKNFALKLVKHLPFSESEIFNSLTELLNEKVLHLEDDKIYQKRMVKDNLISLKRSEAGQKGGKQTQFAKANNEASSEAKSEANSENEIEYEDDIKNKNINIPFENFWDLYEKKVGDKIKIEKKWNKLTNEDRNRIMEYIPKYKKATPDKKYRKNPDTFFNQKSWNDEIIGSTQLKFTPNNSSYE